MDRPHTHFTGHLRCDRCLAWWAPRLAAGQFSHGHRDVIAEASQCPHLVGKSRCELRIGAA
jgi:hypothetical protein